jgi:ATP-dependent RNA helicase DeaD
MSTKLFSELGLSEEILKAVQRLGFEQASPIQAEAIPVLMTGQDIVGQSQTGSGKTAAFAIPAIERMDPKASGPQVLILCPTRELAIQVSEEVHKLAFFKRGVKPLPIYGGQSYERQFSGLRAGANVIIGTPGRIIDHIDRKTLQRHREDPLVHPAGAPDRDVLGHGSASHRRTHRPLYSPTGPGAH